MNKRDLIYTGLLMLAMITSPVVQKKQVFPLCMGRQILMRRCEYCDSGKSKSIHVG